MPILAADTVSIPTLIVAIVGAVIVVGLVVLWFIRNPNQRP